jgi:hypothetical protein
MRILIERLGLRTTGIILMVLAAALLVIALLIAWNAVARWQAIAALSGAQLARLGGDEPSARRELREAGEDLPTLPATVLPGVDLGDESAAGRLEALRARVPARDRHDVDTVLALHRALRGQDAGVEVAGSDANLLTAIRLTAKADAAPAKVAYDADLPPHVTILHAALQRQFRAAWLAGDGEAIRRSAGPLLLMAPTEPDAPRLRLILTALGPTVDASALHAAGGSIGNLDERLALIRALLRLAPVKAQDQLISLIPPERQLPEEQEAALLGTTTPLEQQVQKVLASPTPAALRALLDRALQAGRTDLAKQLLAKLPADAQQPVLVQLATADGDLDALIHLLGEQPELQLRISPVVVAGGHAAFHLATSSGLVPRTGIQIRLAGKEVDPARLQRLASLVVVDLGATAGALEVRYGQKVVASAQVTP